MPQIVRLDLTRAVVTFLELGNAAGVDVEAGHRRALAGECHRNRQADIAEADHR